MSGVMVRFINRISGDSMWVASDRVEEYKAAGHVLAADLGTRPKTPEPVKAAKVEEPKAATNKEVKKTVVRKKK